VTFESDDFDRILYADAELLVEGLRDLKTRPRRRLMKFIRNETYKHANAGVRDKHEILRRVMAATEEKFGSIFLLAILAAVVQFLVLKILNHIWPNK
jgi:hypothetical protein